MATIPNEKQDLMDSDNQYATRHWVDKGILFFGGLLVFLLLYFASPFGDAILNVGVAILCAVGINMVIQAGMLWAMGLNWKTLGQSIDTVNEEDRWRWILVRVFGASANLMVALGIQIVGNGANLMRQIQIANLWFGIAWLFPVAHGNGSDATTALLSLVTSSKRKTYRLVGVLSMAATAGMYAVWKQGKLSENTFDLTMYMFLGSMIALYKGFVARSEGDNTGGKDRSPNGNGETHAGKQVSEESKRS